MKVKCDDYSQLNGKIENVNQTTNQLLDCLGLVSDFTQPGLIHFAWRIHLPKISAVLEGKINPAYNPNSKVSYLIFMSMKAIHHSKTRQGACKTQPREQRETGERRARHERETNNIQRDQPESSKIPEKYQRKTGERPARDQQEIRKRPKTHLRDTTDKPLRHHQDTTETPRNH